MSAAPATTAAPPPAPSRAELRLRSISWALAAGLSALGLGLVISGLEAGLRACGCGLLYGLLAFHLQRVDPGDGHLQAGLVGAVCGIHSLGLPPLMRWPLEAPLSQSLARVAPAVMMELVRAWLPLIGAALVLHGSQALSRSLATGQRPISRP
jgi:hypothetical protein